MNHVTLLGRLVADPELKYTQGGSAVCKVTVAVDRPPTKGGEKVADFIPVTVWGKSAENLAQYLRKGSQLAVEGELHIDRVERDGKASYFTSVNARRVEFVGGRQGGQQGTQAPQGQAYSKGGQPIGQEVAYADPDLPF